MTFQAGSKRRKIFYVHSEKVCLPEPFGGPHHTMSLSDDDDVELNYLLDRHAQVSMAFADYICTQGPPLYVDRFFESKHVWLPHTKLSAEIDDHPPSLHTHLTVRKHSLFDLIDRSDRGKSTLDPTAALASPVLPSTMQQTAKKKKGKQDTIKEDDTERVLYF